MIEISNIQIPKGLQTPDGMRHPNPILSALKSLPMAAKPKYWVTRIIDALESQERRLDNSRVSLIRSLGQPVEFVLDVANDLAVLENGVSLNAGVQPQGRWVPITDPDKLSQQNVQWMVKEENQAEFDVKMAELLAEKIIIPFNAINIDDLKNSKGEPVNIPFDLTPILWMFTEPVGDGDGVSGG